MALLVRTQFSRRGSQVSSFRSFGGIEIFGLSEEDKSSNKTRTHAHHRLYRHGPIFTHHSPRLNHSSHQTSRNFQTFSLIKPFLSSSSPNFHSNLQRSQSHSYNLLPRPSIRWLSSQVNPPSDNFSKAQTSEEKVQPDKKSQTMVKVSTAQVSDRSFLSKISDSLIGAGKATVSFLIKIPGVLWYYITHSKERKEKWIEIKEAAKKEAHHYWMGTKLLAADIRTARVLVARTLRGSSLSRRERKQLQRTVSDIFRLVPFSVFVIVPFMEFTLPFFLRIFPNMLPSTYQDSLKEEENMKRELQSRLAIAEFFQETLQNLANEQKKAAITRNETTVGVTTNSDVSPEETAREHTAESFLEFLEKARHGEMFPPEVIIKYSTYFKDEMTLDNMPRMQLINMCKYMNIPPYGSDNLLRLQLRHRVKALREDDQRIIWEGIDSLTKMELREACGERGMRSTGLSKESYKRALQQWIDLSVNRNVPVSLLIMSRIFFLQDEDAYRYPSGSKHMGGLADAITGMDKEVINEVVLDVATSKEKVSSPDVLKIKLEVLQQQNELIAEEKKVREAAVAKMAEKEHEKVAKDVSQESKPVQDEIPRELPIASSMINMSELNVKIDAGPVSIPSDIFRAQTESLENKEGVLEPQLSSKEIDAIKHLISPDPVSAEREKLERLKAAIQVESIPLADSPKSLESPSIDNVPETIMVTPTQKTDNIMDNVSESLKVGSDVESTSLSLKISDVEAVETIKNEEYSAAKEAMESTSFTSGVQPHESVSAEAVSSDDASSKSVVTSNEDRGDAKLDIAITRLKSKVESMVGKLEVQLDSVEKKIGDKLHHLDKDLDGILSREEMALCLQSVLKRPLSFDEAMAIAKDMDENQDGYFSLDELSKWLETNKLVKLVKEGKEDEVERLIAEQTRKLNKVESGIDNIPSGATTTN